MANADAGRLYTTETDWTDAGGNDRCVAAAGAGIDESRPLPDFSRLGLLLCFASAVLTLIGVGSALERIFS